MLLTSSKPYRERIFLRKYQFYSFKEQSVVAAMIENNRFYSKVLKVFKFKTKGIELFNYIQFI